MGAVIEAALIFLGIATTVLIIHETNLNSAKRQIGQLKREEGTENLISWLIRGIVTIASNISPRPDNNDDEKIKNIGKAFGIGAAALTAESINLAQDAMEASKGGSNQVSGTTTSSSTDAISQTMANNPTADSKIPPFPAIPKEGPQIETFPKAEQQATEIFVFPRIDQKPEILVFPKEEKKPTITSISKAPSKEMGDNILWNSGNGGASNDSTNLSGKEVELKWLSDNYKAVEINGTVKVNGKVRDISRRVYQMEVDWEYRPKDPSANGLTNKELALKGRSPYAVDKNGSEARIELHHLVQVEAGSMVEIVATTHDEYTKILHGLVESGGSFRNNTTFDKQYSNFLKKYWRWRAKNI